MVKLAMKVIEARQTPEEVVLMSWSPKMDLLALGNIKGDLTIHRLSWVKVWQVKVGNNVENSLKKTTAAEDEDHDHDVVELITWHPEGIFLAVVTTSRNFVLILDVETGQTVHKHSLLDAKSPISTINWSQSSYEICTTEIVESMALRNGAYRTSSNDLKLQRLESLLSLLLIGTSNGLVFIYSGGFLFTMCLKIPTPTNTLVKPTNSTSAAASIFSTEILDILLFDDLESFQFLIDMNYSGAATGQQQGGGYLTLCHFKNDIFSKVAELIGPLGFRYIFFIKNLTILHGEFAQINDHWSKVVDVYMHYMTYGQKKLNNEPGHVHEEVRADYLELLLTSVTSLEMEIFLGTTGREKEAKKFISSLSLAYNSIMEHLRILHSTLVFLLTDLNEIGGFLHRISRYDQEANRKIIQDLKKSFTLLYLGTLELKKLLSNFGELSIHFMHLVVNTIRMVNNVSNIAEDVIEDESADTEKVLEFLRHSVRLDIVDFLFANVRIGFSSTSSSLIDKSDLTPLILVNSFEEILSTYNPNVVSKSQEIPSSSTTATAKSSTKSKKSSPPKIDSNSDASNFSFVSFIDYLQKNELKEKNTTGDLLDFTDHKAKKIIAGLRSLPILLNMAEKLLQIPVLCSIPFEADNYPLMPIPVQQQQPEPTMLETTLESPSKLKQKSTSKSPQKGAKGKKVPQQNKINKEKITGLVMNQVTGKSYAYLKWDAFSIYLFEFDVTNESALVRSIRLIMNRSISFIDFFSDSYLTLLSYATDPANLNTSTSACAEDKDKDKSLQESSGGRAILAQLNFSQLILKGTQVDLMRKAMGNRRQQRRAQKPPQPNVQKITIPLEQLTKSVSATLTPNTSSASINSNPPYIDLSLPIDGFLPSMMSVQGARKVGSLLGGGDNLRTILLIDMEQDFSDESFDDEDEDED